MANSFIPNTALRAIKKLVYISVYLLPNAHEHTTVYIQVTRCILLLTTHSHDCTLCISGMSPSFRPQKCVACTLVLVPSPFPLPGSIPIPTHKGTAIPQSTFQRTMLLQFRGSKTAITTYNIPFTVVLECMCL